MIQWLGLPQAPSWVFGGGSTEEEHGGEDGEVLGETEGRNEGNGSVGKVTPAEN